MRHGVEMTHFEEKTCTEFGLDRNVQRVGPGARETGDAVWANKANIEQKL